MGSPAAADALDRYTADTRAAQLVIGEETSLERLDRERQAAALEAVREEAHAVGILQTLDYQHAHNELLKYVVLMRLRDAKEYRKRGRTWAQFCEEEVGESHRNVDRKIADIRPVVEAFGTKFSQISSLEWRQIRLLGRSLGTEMSQIEAGTLVIAGDRIPLTPDHADDLREALEALQEGQRKLLEEKDATLRTKDKLLKSKEDLIQRQARDLARLERAAEVKGLTAEEAAFTKTLDELRTVFDGVMAGLDPARAGHLATDAATPQMTAAYLSTLDYLRKRTIAAHNAAVSAYGDPDTCPEDAWTPPPLEALRGGHR